MSVVRSAAQFAPEIDAQVSADSQDSADRQLKARGPGRIRWEVVGGSPSSPADEIARAVNQILAAVGEDPRRDGLVGTPRRVARMYRELLAGYEQDLATVVNEAYFDVEYGQGEMVVVNDIPLESLCEHHMLPFTGRAHVGYVPKDRVIGLSKIPRIVDMFARRLQIQERLVNQVADAIIETLEPEGVIVVVEAHHACASLRGVKKHSVNMVTTASRGVFTEADRRTEFYTLAGLR